MVQWRVCEAGAPSRCAVAAPERLALGSGITELHGTIRTAFPAGTPPPVLAVDIDAMASAEVRWNGVRIGSNGRVGADRQAEIPGLYSASFVVPAALVRPGWNTIAIRLSTRHLWLPVSHPIHRLRVGPPDDARAYTLRHYLPTIATLGLPAATLLILVVLLRRGRSASWTLAPAAALALVFVQGCLELSKLAVAYTYPWHFARLAVLAGLTASVAVLLVAVSARIHAPGRTRVLTLGAAGMALLAMFAVGGWDQKALAGIQIGLAGAALVTAKPAWTRARGARVVFAASSATLAWSILAGPDFLDRGYYVAAALAGLGLSLCALPSAGQEPPPPHSAPPTAEPETPVIIRHAGRTEVLRPSQVVHLTAADDYCSIQFVDGRQVLVSMTLKALLARLPSGFVRIHRSYAINIRHLVGVRSSPKGTRIALLADGTSLAIGRTYAAGVEALLAADQGSGQAQPTPPASSLA